MTDDFYKNNLPQGDDDGEERTSLLSDLPRVEDEVPETEGNSGVEPSEPIASDAEDNTSADDSVQTGYTAQPYTHTRVYGSTGYADPYQARTVDQGAPASMPQEPATSADRYTAPYVPNTESDRVEGRSYRDGFTYNPGSVPRPAENVNPYAPKASDNEKKHDKKEKRARISGGLIAVILIVCILVSAVSGFAGSMLASGVKKSTGNSDDALQINKVDTESVDYEALADKPTTAITSEVADTVVEITTESMETSSFYGQYISEGAGSGVIISDDGYILTNNHVISGATSITVTTRSGESYTGTLVGADSELDIALVKIEATGLKKATFGDSSKLEVGSKAVIIGNPLGTLGGSVTEGIISALDRSIVIDGKTMHLIQTDASINPGNSGGGMFDGQGMLSGIVVAKSSSQEIDNIGFVIPINNVIGILGDLKDYGYVRGRASTGMEFMDLSNAMFAYYYYRSTEPGVYINAVETGSNAAKAGFQRGDRVVSVDGKSISTSDEITTIISSKSAGDTVTFEVSRRGSSKTLTLQLEEKVPDGVQKNSSSQTGGYTR